MQRYTVIVHDYEEIDTSMYRVEADSPVDAACVVCDFLERTYAYDDEDYDISGVIKGWHKDNMPTEAGWRVIDDERRGHVYDREGEEIVFKLP